MMNTRPHLSVEQWLSKLDLSLYLSVFKEYDGVEEMLHLSERELKSLGIRNSSHRARMATSLAVLKDKYVKAVKGCSPNTSCLSLKVDSSTSRSHGSLSPAQRLQKEAAPSGVRSWPSSGQSSVAHSRHSSHRSSMECSIGADATVEELKKGLEYELNLERSDLRSHGWYHGTILRQRAEELMLHDGDFLVRDCISQPGDFVITCKWNSTALHFIIKKEILQPNTTYEKIQFCFEDEHFDSIQDFITYYVGGQCPLSSTSGALICNPINRSMPLSYYTSRYSIQCQIQYAAIALEKIPPVPSMDSLEDMFPRRDETADESVRRNRFPPKRMASCGEFKKRPALVRVESDPSLNPNAEKKTFENRPNSGTFTTEAGKEIASRIESDKPPPKPSRVPSKKWCSKPLVVQRERKNTPPTPFIDSPHGEWGDNAVTPTPTCPIPYRRMMSGETRFSFLDHASVSSEGSLADLDAVKTPFTIPSLRECSCFDPSALQSVLLNGCDNKPLEVSALNQVKQLLLCESSKTVSSHLSRIDLEISRNIKDEDLGLGVTSGLELILLPQGQQLVEDLLERTHCLKTFVAVTILTCATEEERIKILGKWIEVAIDAKNSYGNFYGFTGIMLGLTIPQVSNLHGTWLELRRLRTEMTFAFETKLRPAFKAMQEASVQVAPNTCIPYILSLLSILHHQLRVMQSLEENPAARQEISERDFNFGMPVEENSADFGLQVLEDHLEASRTVLQQWPVFQNNTDLSLKRVKYKDELLDLFRTEFHMRLLWGSRGAVVESKERHAKFSKVLDVLFTRYENCSSG